MRSFAALAVLACGIAALSPAVCRAEFITPDSIHRPAPGNVGPADNSPVSSPGDLVTNQYAALGLTFPPQPSPGPAPLTAVVAIASIDGVNVWVPALEVYPTAGRVAVLNYTVAIHGKLAAPIGTLAVEVMGTSGPLLAFDAAGDQIGFDFSDHGRGPHGGRLLEVNAAGIESFTVLGPVAYDCPPEERPAWGIAGVSGVAPAGAPLTVPEPSSLLLAALGAVGFAFRAVRSRPRRVSAS